MLKIDRRITKSQEATLLACSKASSFRSRFQELLTEEMKNDIDTTKVINRELNESFLH